MGKIARIYIIGLCRTLMEIFGYIVSGLVFLIVKNNLAIFLFDAYFYGTLPNFRGKAKRMSNKTEMITVI